MGSTPSNLNDLVLLVLDLIGVLLPVLASAAVLFFIWGLVKFIYKSGDAKSHADGKQFMIWSVVALFVLVSFMGIMQLVFNDLGFDNSNRGATNIHFGLPYLPVNH